MDFLMMSSLGSDIVALTAKFVLRGGLGDFR